MLFSETGMLQGCCSNKAVMFTFIHAADAFIQSDLQCIKAIHLYGLNVCSLGIEPTTFALLMQCFMTEPQEHVQTDKFCILTI